MDQIGEKRIALVLGGGGLKGFAHVGVLRALQERGIRPALFAGTSIGALIAAAHVGGMSTDEMQRKAESLRRDDLFRLNRMRILFDRFHSPSIYLPEPLSALCEASVPALRFDELTMPLLVNTVDVERGTQVVWGRPGLRNVPVADAVYASCALPGFFPPGRVDGRVCVDGGTVDNMPVSVAALGMDAVIAVDVGNSGIAPESDIAGQGFASVFMRSATIMMHALQELPLADWAGPPMILVRPRVTHIGWFSFGRTEELIAAGYRAAYDALDHLDECLAADGGIFPKRQVRITVDRDKCVSCGICVAQAPRLMAFDAHQKAYALDSRVEWSPADGDFVRQCPTDAIAVQVVDDQALKASA